MRTPHDIEQGLNDELVAARILSEMGFRPAHSANRRGAGYGGTDAPSHLIRNADGDTFERRADDSLVMVGVELSEAEKIDREMEQRGGLLRAIEPEPGSIRLATPEEMELIRGGQGRSPEDIALVSLITLGLAGVAVGLIIRAIVGGGS